MSASPSFDIRGRVALVTGASSGLGRHFASTLAAHGAMVVLAARRLDALEALAAQIGNDGGRAMAVRMDVTDAASVSAALDAAQAEYGPPRIVVNNSGVARPSPALQTDDEAWHAVLETNLTGAFRVARESARRMVEAQVSGSIINIASILALRVGAGLSAYAASKAGLRQLTAALSLELARNAIRVNAIAPGYIDTEMNQAFFATDAGRQMVRRIPQRRLGSPSDLDGALLLLASDASSYMTGATIVIDGGHVHSNL